MNPLETAARIAASAKDAPELNREDVPPGFARGVAEAAAWIEAQIRMVPVGEGEFQRGVRAGLEVAADAAAMFSMKPDRNLHPDVPWEQMSDHTKNIVHMTAQSISAVIRIATATVADGGGDGR